jgi:hypothetical protein
VRQQAVSFQRIGGQLRYPVWIFELSAYPAGSRLLAHILIMVDLESGWNKTQSFAGALFC